MRRRGAWFVALALVACSADVDNESSRDEHVGTVKQAITDTDSDGMDDGWETTHFGGLSQTASGDFDSDGMTNLEEYVNGFDPTVNDAFDDADGDRYPNVFEVRNSADPNDAGSTPTATYVVNAGGGGTHTTISGALSAANVTNGSNFQIIAIAPGVYTGGANLHDVTIASTKPKLLFIGLDGAGKTIIDGGLANYGWVAFNSAVIASVTFRNALTAAYVDASGGEVRFVDVVMRNNAGAGPGYSAAVHVNAASRVNIVGSAFVDNTASASAHQIWFGAGNGTLTNTVVWGQATGTNLAKASGATLTTNYSLVKGQTLTGTGNLAGTTDPKLRSDFRLLWDSPLRAAGGTVSQSRIDIDGELRPSSAPDIGVDQFLDSDSDDLADAWETAEAGNLTALTSRTQDADSDGLTNDQEYAAFLKPTVADTDGDGASDGAEVNTYGTNPLLTDTDGDDMPDGWEISHGLAATVANGFDDADGDRYPNVFEYAASSDPSSASSVPTPTYVVNPAGGGTHTTIGAAINAADVANGAYQIIGIAPGVYTGTNNLSRDIPSWKPKLLIIGLEGAAKTILDGELMNSGWVVYRSAIISSLTFTRMSTPFYVNDAAVEARFVDLLVRDNRGTTGYSTGVYVNNAKSVDIIGSTFVDNISAGTPPAEQIYFGGGVAKLTNTVVWGSTGGTKVATNWNVTLTTSHCLVKGQTMSGSGNLAGTTDPRFRSDAHLRWDSPLRTAGVGVAQSRIDLDGELRPSSTPDIGVDQFNDVDSDLLPDGWEIATAGNTTTIAGAADADGDGLTNAEEWDRETDWMDPDTDKDLVADGLEVTLGTNPRVADADDLGGDVNDDGIIDSIGVQLGYSPNQTDDDGDSISNANEVLMCTNPVRADTDGDGIPDDSDPFPHDPLMTSLPSSSGDTTAPVITLTAPWNAVLQ